MEDKDFKIRSTKI